MKLLLLLIIYCTITIPSLSQNGEILKDKIDQKFGFRDIKLETPYSSYKAKQLKLVEENDKFKVYESKVENLQVGDYKLKSISYIFYRDSLAEIIIQTKGLANSDGLLKILKESYGEGFKGNRYMERYLWQGDKATIYYDQNSITHDAILTILSNRLDKIRQETDNYSNKKAAETDF